MVEITILPMPTPAPDSIDTDRDGVPDDYELIAGTDPLKKDTDDDGREDGFEMGVGFDPIIADDFSSITDTDGDGIPDVDDPDPAKTDADGDRFADWWELAVSSDPLNAEVTPDLGDLSGDGDLDYVDIVLLMSHITGEETALTRDHLADVNRDQVVDMADGVILFNWYLENIPMLPAQ